MTSEVMATRSPMGEDQSSPVLTGASPRSFPMTAPSTVDLLPLAVCLLIGLGAVGSCIGIGLARSEHHSITDMARSVVHPIAQSGS